MQKFFLSEELLSICDNMRYPIVWNICVQCYTHMGSFLKMWAVLSHIIYVQYDYLKEQLSLKHMEIYTVSPYTD